MSIINLYPVQPTNFVLDLKYYDRGAWYTPCVCEGITWETSRSGSPGILTWDMYTDHVIEPGDVVELADGSTKLFHGFAFTTSHSKDGKIHVTAYDQLRYLKNTDSFIFEHEPLEMIIKFIADTYRLTIGNLDKTGVLIDTYNGDNKTLFDIIGDLLDTALMENNKLFILYDDVGKLTLKNIENMTLPLMITSSTTEDYDLQTTIDSQTYNLVKLVFTDSNSSSRKVYMAKDEASISKYGLLEKYETGTSSTNATKTLNNDGSPKANTGDDEAHAIQKVNTLLQLYNSVQRSATLKGVPGDNRVRGGSRIYVRLNMGNVMQDNYMIVDRVTHKWEGNVHTMDLVVEGAAINSAS